MVLKSLRGGIVYLRIVAYICYMKMNNYNRTWDNINRVWVYEHRVVMEQYLGRTLSSEEHIHHIDGNPKNNNINNLEVVSAEEHCRIHKPALKNRLCGVVDCDKKHHAKGYCKKHYAKIFRKSQGW